MEEGCEAVLQALLDEYPLVFVDHLTPSIFIDSEPVKIHMK